MMQAGFNEINAGCRAYVQFVFEERMRESRFKSSNSAIQAFISGILTLEGAGPRLFSYLILSSSAANAFYDASRIDPLQGMTLENILNIVSERQAAFEKATTARTVISRPQLVRVWREYQWLCTPLSITTDINYLAAAGLDGRKVDFDADARRLVNNITATIGQVEKFQPGAGLRPTEKQEAPAGALNLFEEKLSPSQVETIRLALCLPKGRSFDIPMRSAIREWRKSVSETNPTPAVLGEGLSSSEGAYLNGQSCSSIGFGYKTPYERGFFYDAPAREKGATIPSKRVAREERMDWLTKKLGIAPNDDLKFGATLRQAISKKRTEFEMLTSDTIDSDFMSKLSAAGEKQ